MNILQKTIAKLDTFQQHHRLPGFTYAVIKKYGDDEAGYQAALLTYYGFLSLFPLLLVLTTLTGLLAHRYPHLQYTVIHSLSSYFPVLGNQLSEHVQTLHKGGLALVVGIIFTIYGARGVADAFQHGVNHIWHIPHQERLGFPKAAIKSLVIIVAAGVGLVTASATAGFAASAGHGILFRTLSIVINIAVLFWLFAFLLNFTLPRRVSLKQIRGSALTAAIGLVILQALGGYLLGRQLKNLDALYSSFAVALGLLFWLYLQSQMLYYSLEVASVKSQNLWPRSLSGDLTPADKRSYSFKAKAQKMVTEENIKTRFQK